MGGEKYLHAKGGEKKKKKKKKSILKLFCTNHICNEKLKKSSLDGVANGYDLVTSFVGLFIYLFLPFLFFSKSNITTKRILIPIFHTFSLVNGRTTQICSRKFGFHVDRYRDLSSHFQGIYT